MRYAFIVRHNNGNTRVLYGDHPDLSENELDNDILELEDDEAVEFSIEMPERLTVFDQDGDEMPFSYIGVQP